MSNSLPTIRVGTRASRLALVQTRAAVERLGALLPSVRFDVVERSSPGDRDRGMDLRRAPDDFFTRDLDEAVRRGELDAALHSAKDVPEPGPADLDWCWLPWREDPRDALVLRHGETPADLPPRPAIGVSSERRESWALRRFPGARPRPLRGNIEQRLQQLDDGRIDALLMAGCALLRLGLAERVTEWLALHELAVPEGQGALALTFRAGDPRLQAVRSLWIKAAFFVGAGAGRRGLCTLDGMRALERAEVCLYDTLLDPGLLDALPAAAQRIDVGKRCGERRLRQEQITELLVRHVRRGRRVVRLKGGDPGLFGRLAEETEACEALRLPFHVVPGVSSLCAGSTGTGMLLTRRGESAGFSAVTARGGGGGLTPLDAASRSRHPLVLFMGSRVAGEAARSLAADGWAADTPAALVWSAGSEDEHVLRATLGTLARRLAEEESVRGAAAGPGLLIVGCAAAHGYRRDGALGGARVLLTCSEALMGRARAAVRDAGGVPVARPMVRLVCDPAAEPVLRRLDRYDWLVLTSPSAARCFAASLIRAGVDLRGVPRLLVCGPGTAGELERMGLRPAACAEQSFGTEGVLRCAGEVLSKQDRVLRLRSDRAGPALASGLGALSDAVDDVVLYRNQRVEWKRCPDFEAAFFASASAVDNLVAQWGAGALAGKVVAVMGDPTAGALRRSGVEPEVRGREATLEGALSALSAWMVDKRLSNGQGAVPNGVEANL